MKPFTTCNMEDELLIGGEDDFVKEAFGLDSYADKAKSTAII